MQTAILSLACDAVTLRATSEYLLSDIDVYDGEVGVTLVAHRIRLEEFAMQYFKSRSDTPELVDFIG